MIFGYIGLKKILNIGVKGNLKTSSFVRYPAMKIHSKIKWDGCEWPIENGK